MILGIDAANIRYGGGLNHLVEFLASDCAEHYGFSKVIVWSGRRTLSLLEDRPWLVKSHQGMLDRNLVFRAYWQRFILPRLLNSNGCDLLFVPGGTFLGKFRPFVVFSQNILPFEWGELLRYGLSLMTIKWLLLRRTQSNTFRAANGIIFLTQYARDAVLNVIGKSEGVTTVIPHGVENGFRRLPRAQKGLDSYSRQAPFKLLYVAHVDMFKHQWVVAEAIAILRGKGVPVALEFVGPAYPPALKRLQRSIKRFDQNGEYLRYIESVPHASLKNYYFNADLFVFASSCESFGQILVEAMAAGLPIACSNRSAMPELLGDAGLYFDPEDPSDIARAIEELIRSPQLRLQKARRAFELANLYSWDRCACDTWLFLQQTAREFHNSRNLVL